MQILGIEPVLAAIIISLIAVTLRTWWGMTEKSIDEFNIRTFSQTVVIGLLVAVVTVAGSIEVFPETATKIQQLMFVVSQISAVIGIDYAVKQGKNRILNKKSSEQEKEFEELAEDMPDNVPPEKGETK